MELTRKCPPKQVFPKQSGVQYIVICMVDNLAAAAALSAVGYGNILKWGSRDNTKSLPGIYIYLCILYNMYMY